MNPEVVKSDIFGPLNEFKANRPHNLNPGGVFSDYEIDGSLKVLEEEEEDEEDEILPVQAFQPFNNESEFKRRPPKQYRGMKGYDVNEFTFSLSDNCYITYNTTYDDEDGVRTIAISSFQCNNKGDGKKLMNVFLYHYLDENSISPKDNIYVILTAVSHVDQTKLNQYYRDIGFQQLDRYNNFKGNINDILHYTGNYIKGARGLRKKTKMKTKIVSKRRTKLPKKNTRKNK